VAWFVAIVLLSASLVLMEISFIDMTRMIRYHRMRAGLVRLGLAALFVLVLGGSLLLGLGDAVAWSVGVIVLFFFLTIINIVGPTILYVRSASSMRKAAGRSQPSTCLLIKAFLMEVFRSNNAMRRTLGDYDYDGSLQSSSKHVITYSRVLIPRASGRQFPATSESIQMMRFHAGNNDDPSLTDTTKERLMNILNRASTQIINSNNQKREAALVEFLGRAMRMSFNMSLGLLSYCVLTGLYIYYLPLTDDGPEVRIVGLILALRIICFTLMLWQILWFLVRESSHQPTATNPPPPTEQKVPHQEGVRVQGQRGFPH
jgi:hypothetical protein